MSAANGQTDIRNPLPNIGNEVVDVVDRPPPLFCLSNRFENCVPGGIEVDPPGDPEIPVLGSLPDIPPRLLALADLIGEEGVGLLYQQAAALSQLTNNAGSVALGFTNDIVSSVLGNVGGGDVSSASVTGPFAAGSPGSASSMFMVSGYKHLAHDGYNVSTAFDAAAGKSPEFEEDSYGFTIGTRFDGSEIFGAPARSVTFGVLANYTHTDIDISAPDSLPSNLGGSADIDSWSAGGYGLVTDGTRYGLMTLVGTFGSPESENGPLAATADYATFGFAASAVSGVLVPVGTAKLDLRGGVNYLTSHGEDFTDTIGSRYEDARTEELSGSVSARLFSLVRLEDMTLRPFVQGGLNHRFHYENQVTIDTVEFTFDDADTSVFARTGVDFDLTDSAQGYLAIRGDASDDMRAFAAQIGVTFKLD